MLLRWNHQAIKYPFLTRYQKNIFQELLVCFLGASLHAYDVPMERDLSLDFFYSYDVPLEHATREPERPKKEIHKHAFTSTGSKIKIYRSTLFIEIF